jgi:hypothetical protein
MTCIVSYNQRWYTLKLLGCKFVEIMSADFCTWQPLMDPVQFPNFSNCSLLIDGWDDIFEMFHNGSFKYDTGGLGPSRINDIYLTWICIEGRIPWPAR